MKYTMIILPMTLFLGFCTPEKRKAASDDTAAEDHTESLQSVHLTKAWSSEPVLTTCESTLYDKQRNIIYVANINGKPAEKNGQGFISKLQTDGTIAQLRWIDGLHAPKGMAIYNNVLYVTDIDVLVEIDIERGVVNNTYPVEKASFLNDVAVDEQGTVYFTDSDTGRIHRLQNGVVSVWKEDQGFERPNGLYHRGDELLLALSGNGQLQSINYSTGTIDVLADGLGHGDGIAPDGKGNLFVSNWAGQVFLVSAEGAVHLLLDTRDQEKNSADIDYIAEENLLLVPTFFSNMVEAYSVDYTQ